MEQNLFAYHERQFATPPPRAAPTASLATVNKQELFSTRTSAPPKPVGTSRRLMPTSARHQRRRCACARPGNRASAPRHAPWNASQPHKPESSHSADTQPRPRAGNERNAKHQIANPVGSTTTDHRDAPVREPQWLAGRQRTDGPPEQWRRARTAQTSTRRLASRL